MKILSSRYRHYPLLRIQDPLFLALLYLSIFIPYQEMLHFIPALWKPQFIFQFFEINPQLIILLIWIWRIVLLFNFIFFKSRFLIFITLLLSFFNLSLYNSFGIEYHVYAPLMVALLALIIIREQGLNKQAEQSMAFCCKFILVCMLFSAGLSKLKLSGINWPFSESLYHYFTNLYYMKTDILVWTLPLREWILNYPILIAWGGLLVFFLELISPIALFFHFASRIVLYACALFFLFTFGFLAINFFIVWPLLWGWGLSKKSFFDLKSSRLLAMALVIFLSSQLYITYFYNKNIWPLMKYDMYASPYYGPEFKKVHVELISLNNKLIKLDDSNFFRPFTRFHFFYTFMKNNSSRQQVLYSFLMNYLHNNCKIGCDDITGVRVVQDKGTQQVTVLAEAKRRKD